MLQSVQSFTADITDKTDRTGPRGRALTPSAPAEDLAGFDVAAIAVPTPLRDGTPDLSHIQRRATLRDACRPFALSPAHHACDCDARRLTLPNIHDTRSVSERYDAMSGAPVVSICPVHLRTEAAVTPMMEVVSALYTYGDQCSTKR
jgi:hypothetical protein